MILYRPTLCALALSVGVPLAGGAKAEAGGRLIFGVNQNESSSRVDVLASGEKTRVKFGQCWVFASVGSSLAPDGTGTSATASITSDAGSEDVTLAESNAWLHGAATLKALPKTDATLALTLYDKASASFVSFSGTLTTNGVVTLTADATKDTSTDVEVLAGEVFAATSGYELTVDLAGADTYEVAYGTFVVTEGKTETKAEIGWDATGSVWDGDLTLEHEGVIETKVTTYDSAGKKLESSKSKLGEAWSDDGEGINVLATDEDPLTVVGMLGRRVDILPDGRVLYVASRLAIVSEGWTSTTVPASAKVELTGGSTITIPVNSYQRKGGLCMLSGLVRSSRMLVTHGGTTIYDSSVTDLGERSCTDGTCATFVEDEDGDYALSVSEYGLDALKLADTVELTLTTYDKSGVKESSEGVEIEFEDDVSAVFANDVSFTEDPVGLDLSGKVSLLSAADSKGKEKTLAKGKFYGSLSRDGDGDLGLAGADKDVVSSKGSIVKAGSAVAFELTDTDKDGVISGPPLAPKDAPGGKKGKNSHNWSLEENKGA